MFSLISIQILKAFYVLLLDYVPFNEDLNPQKKIHLLIDKYNLII